VELLQRGLPGQEELGARLLSVRAGDLEFTTLYCPNGKHTGHEDYPRKLAWLDALAEYLAQRARTDARSVVCGDFNVCPEPIDSWNEELLRGAIFHTDAERERFGRLLAAGFVDLFRRLHPDEQAFSWWDYRGGAFHRRMGLRIDLLLATPPALARIRAAEIDREYRKKQDGQTPSDHAPVWVDLELNRFSTGSEFFCFSTCAR
jgi:exodeoxyribonuclease-3